MSYLSVFVQYHAAVAIAFQVPPTAFEPAPAVDSAVIVVEPTTCDDRLDPTRRTAFGGSSRPAFRERRKMIHNVLTRQLPVDAGARRPQRWPRPASTRDRRPQTLAVGEWLALREALGRWARTGADGAGDDGTRPAAPRRSQRRLARSSGWRRQSST